MSGACLFLLVAVAIGAFAAGGVVGPRLRSMVAGQELPEQVEHREAMREYRRRLLAKESELLRHGYEPSKIRDIAVEEVQREATAEYAELQNAMRRLK